MKKINWKTVGIWVGAFAIPFGHTVLVAYYVRRWYKSKHAQRKETQ